MLVTKLISRKEIENNDNNFVIGILSTEISNLKRDKARATTYHVKRWIDGQLDNLQRQLHNVLSNDRHNSNHLSPNVIH